MKINELRTPCYVIDEGKLTENLLILNGVMQRTGARILLAQKAFSAFYEYPLIGRYLSGTTASGLFEARLAHEEMGKAASPDKMLSWQDEALPNCPFLWNKASPASHTVLPPPA